MPLKASLKKYPELGIKFCAIIFAILSFYFAKTLSQRDPESKFFIDSVLVVSLCFYTLYIIVASIKLRKKYEKNLNSGFNLSIVLTFLLTLVSFYLESRGWWTFCIGWCSSSNFDLFMLFAQPFLVPIILLLSSVSWHGDSARKRFFFGVLLSIPFCIFATFCSGFTIAIFQYIVMPYQGNPLF